EYDSANVSGVGEIVEKFDEDELNIEVFIPKISCDTGKIYKIFRENFYKELNKDEVKELFATNSKDILKKFDIKNANDLYLPALFLEKKLEDYAKKNWYFSGSGSSFFKVL
ncbi:4-(cytidine 5'-diphospho)-2-C-methyl-D-erythritol kinase, partial [Aliarcobacter skirrowii]